MIQLGRALLNGNGRVKKAAAASLFQYPVRYNKHTMADLYETLGVSD